MSRVAKTGHPRKRRPLPNLNLDETRGKHASSIFGVSTRETRKSDSARSLAEAANAAPCDYGVAQDRATMNTLRRLCGTMPPTHVPHPPISFAVQLLHRNGPYLRVFSKGKTLDRAQERSRSPWFSVLRVCLRVSVVGRFYARCRYCDLASPGMLYIVKAV